ncbi:hypothetical protein AAFF_G00213160 [Aldrovandia affinis]|uniref:Ferlin B-domain domain-containing protein n=1 Tax=Aldrovandia affinis TaxID=143900 RepID=A0AAD7RHD4_9TELE|nr:hypothetical protein AAFF_G00213160 [Aldrovandia affinis]
MSAFSAPDRRFIAFAEKKVKGNHLTILDKKRLMLCRDELESMVNEVKSITEEKRKILSVKNMLQEALKLNQRLRFLVVEPQHTIPDVFVWMLSNNKRVAYARIAARHLLYSACADHRGGTVARSRPCFSRYP